jgi:hypothetical protein
MPATRKSRVRRPGMIPKTQSILEGGYNVEGNALAAAAHLETLLDGS